MISGLCNKLHEHKCIEITFLSVSQNREIGSRIYSRHLHKRSGGGNLINVSPPPPSHPWTDHDIQYMAMGPRWLGRLTSHSSATAWDKQISQRARGSGVGKGVETKQNKHYGDHTMSTAIFFLYEPPLTIYTRGRLIVHKNLYKL